MKFMTALAWQAIQSVNILQDGRGRDEEGEVISCCPICCGPCHALNEMISDEYTLVMLEAAIMTTGYVVDGWDFWSTKRDGLKVKKIKKLWFNPDGSHKSICMSSNGVDESDALHRAILAESEWKTRVLKD